MIHHFGKVENSQMYLNEYGEIVDKQIKWLVERYPYLIMHNYKVMPNHLHILCEINDSEGTGRDLSVHERIKIKSISELMGAFQTTSSNKIHLAGNKDFKWHRSFHDHIVRDEVSFQRIYKYISDNPARWDEDRFNN